MSAGFALVTGASRGLGASLAGALAEAGYDLILTARDAGALQAQRARLLRPGRQIFTLPADLAHGGATQLLAAVADHAWPLTLLVNNAGVGSLGAFSTLSPEHELDQVRLNLEATVALTRGIVPLLPTHANAAVVNVASTAALQPVPFMATYSATKVFLLHFSLALREELRPSGIHVMALCPGPTRTSFFAAAGIAEPPRLQSPETVARLALRGLRRRQPVVLCTPGATVLDYLERLLPRSTTARLAGQVVRRWRTRA